MKNLFLILLLSGIIFHAHSQTKALANTPTSLLDKSNSQYKAGMILLGGGSAMLLAGLIIPIQYDDYGGTSSNNSFQTFLGVTGALAIVVSIPVFLSSGNNARMAARLSLQNQALHHPAVFPGHPSSVPAISLKIPL